MMLIEGIALGIFIGLVLGTIGAGGAILAVPGLIAVMGLSTVAATTSSLVIVGSAAVAGFIPRLKTKTVDVRLGLTFSALGIFGTFVGTQLVKAVPESVQMILFATLMFGAAIAMWRGPVSETNAPVKSQWPLVFVVASAIGVLTGLLGVGGGFLIVPALVLILKVPTKTAAGTSLVAIASTSAIAFLMRYDYWTEVPVAPIAAFTLAAIIASFLAAPIAGKLNARTLQKGFAVFVTIAATFILISQGF
jgi:uncharacterized membrane protein YfcA